jgi:hypothetical protein
MLETGNFIRWPAFFAGYRFPATRFASVKCLWHVGCLSHAATLTD